MGKKYSHKQAQEMAESGAGYICLGPAKPHNETAAQLLKQIEYEESCRDSDRELRDALRYAYYIVGVCAAESKEEQCD